MLLHKQQNPAKEAACAVGLVGSYASSWGFPQQGFVLLLLAHMAKCEITGHVYGICCQSQGPAHQVKQLVQLSGAG